MPRDLHGVWVRVASRRLKGVIHPSQDLADIEAHTLVNRKPDVAEQLMDPWDALYFSVVTLATVGYGDYVPASAGARLLVTWEIGTGVLLVAGGLALLMSRISNFRTLPDDRRRRR